MHQLIANYLETPSQNTRLDILKSMRQQSIWLPLTLAMDLLCLKLSESEQIAIIQSISNSDTLKAFEDFLTRHIPDTKQNLVTIAIREWIERSDCILWHRMISLCDPKHISQRMAYTLLDHAWAGSGELLIKES